MTRQRAYVACACVALVVCAGLQLAGQGLQLNLLILGLLLAPGLAAQTAPRLEAHLPFPRLQRALELLTLIGCAASLQPGWSMAAALGAVLTWALPRPTDAPAPARLSALTRPALGLAALGVLWQATQGDRLTSAFRLALLVPLLVEGLQPWRLRTLNAELARLAAALAVLAGGFLISEPRLQIPLCVSAFTALTSLGWLLASDAPWERILGAARRGLTGLAAIAGLVGLAGLLASPLATLGAADRGLRVLTLGAVSFALGRALRAADRSRATALRIAVLVGTIPFLIVHPRAIDDGPEASLYLALTLALCGGVLPLPLPAPFVAAGRALAQRRGRLLTLLLPISHATPSVLGEVLRHWDQSGFMDSQYYDMVGAMIATGERAQGESYYMPLFQYMLGGLYYLFGHRFWVAQVAGVLLAWAGLWWLTAAAWSVFGRVGPVLLVAVWGGYTDALHHAVFYPAIENLYVPLFCLTVWRWAAYWRAPSPRQAVWLGVAMALSLNCRTQGAFFFALLFLTPWAVGKLQLRQAATHTVLLVVIVGSSLLPWTIRNAVFDGRFSPSSQQPTIQLAVLNDPRIGLYGVRYDIGYAEIMADYAARYPDPDERLQAMARDKWGKIFGDPQRLVRAVGWRTLAFYGLLPPGVWEPAGPVPTVWDQRTVIAYARYNAWILLLLGLSLLSVLLRPSRTKLFLVAGVLANLSVVVIVGSGEQRISYPSLSLLMLLVAAGLRRVDAEPPADTEAAPRGGLPTARAALGVLIALTLAAALARWLWGAPGARRLVEDPQLTLGATAAVDTSVPRLETWERSAALVTLERPARVVFETRLSPYEYPPHYTDGVPGDFPAFIGDPDRPAVYLTTMQRSADPADTIRVGLVLAGARAERPLHEGDLLRVEGLLLAHSSQGAWVRAETIEIIRPQPE